MPVTGGLAPGCLVVRCGHVCRPEGDFWAGAAAGRESRGPYARFRESGWLLAWTGDGIACVQRELRTATRPPLRLRAGREPCSVSTGWAWCSSLTDFFSEVVRLSGRQHATAILKAERAGARMSPAPRSSVTTPSMVLFVTACTARDSATLVQSTARGWVRCRTRSEPSHPRAPHQPKPAGVGWSCGCRLGLACWR